jgi:hypothetical protein
LSEFDGTNEPLAKLGDRGTIGNLTSSYFASVLGFWKRDLLWLICIDWRDWSLSDSELMVDQFCNQVLGCRIELPDSPGEIECCLCAADCIPGLEKLAEYDCKSLINNDNNHSSVLELKML